MKIFIAFLLIFSSFSDGNVFETNTTVIPSTTTVSTITSSTTTVSTVTPLTTTTTTPVTSSTTLTSSTQSTTTIMSTAQSTTTVTSISISTPIPVTTTQTASPTAEVTVNVTWTFNSGINVTNVLMSIKNLKLGQWAAIGLGQNQTMGEAHVFMCKRLSDDTIAINRYINPGGHQRPKPAGSEQGGLFTPGDQLNMNGVITCQFNLSNFTTQTFKQLKDLRQLSQSTSYYPLFAIGLLDGSDPQKHSSDSCTAQSDSVKLNENSIILYRISNPDVSSSEKYVRAHGIIMVFSWIFIVSTGILISRYFKTSWANNLICGKAAWFAAHRLLMSIAAVLTILGFLFILVALKGTWVDPSDGKRAYTHSITGALVISLAFFQPFIALFRCEPDSRYRFIFNYIHAFVGFSALILSIATLFLATYFRLFSDNHARIIMIVWTIWIVFIFITFEVIQNYFRKSDQSRYSNISSSNKTIDEIVESPTTPTITLTRTANEQETTAEEKIKNILLAIHVLVAAILSIVFSIYIA